MCSLYSSFVLRFWRGKSSQTNLAYLNNSYPWLFIHAKFSVALGRIDEKYSYKIKTD